MFNDNIDVLDYFLDNILDWDKKSYAFDRKEKDMSPYTIKNTEKMCLITHNILGINKEDISIKIERTNGIPYLIINGKTRDSINAQTYSINSKFALNDKDLDLDKIKANAKNGLLYITLPKKPAEPKLEKKNIEIEII